jgi:hypothetical protein
MVVQNQPPTTETPQIAIPARKSFAVFIETLPDFLYIVGLLFLFAGLGLAVGWGWGLAADGVVMIGTGLWFIAPIQLRQPKEAE